MTCADTGLGGNGPARWTPPQSGAFEAPTSSVIPLIAADDFAPVDEDLGIWDAWPIQDPAGYPAVLADGGTLWMALGAPHFDDPDKRHHHARIHLLLKRDGGWTHLGPAMPDGFSPGSREWSGSAVLDAESGMVTLYFTATGRRGEGEPTFLQRMFRARATLVQGEAPRLTDWRDLDEVIVRDPAHYMASESGTGTIGTIKAFRDPAYFLDPKGGKSHLLFAASAADAGSDYNGVVGISTADDASLDAWRIGAPIVTACGLNNELERPHVIHHGAFYYLFWSTQRHVFNPDGVTGPTGLYGMVSDNLLSGWRPLNGTGLVFANPPEAAAQAYSWLVMPDLRVISFVDNWGADRAPDAPRRFGGTFAPDLRLVLEDDQARLIPS
ncbi:glycoside hydrolase family 68 protein [Aurantiacibacter xanthus]|uniref:Glycoside hydrolase family 68 protein n=2 Tax=Aurantiacibacter xanthus TaxID=1784712 RepID=A0A3A1P3I2_9SPHN|nr:glycoside hydrolase family 68 protein [Aurantiacibacter xanthus]